MGGTVERVHLFFPSKSALVAILHVNVSPVQTIELSFLFC